LSSVDSSAAVTDADGRLRPVPSPVRPHRVACSTDALSLFDESPVPRPRAFRVELLLAVTYVK